MWRSSFESIHFDLVFVTSYRRLMAPLVVEQRQVAGEWGSQTGRAPGPAISQRTPFADVNCASRNGSAWRSIFHVDVRDDRRQGMPAYEGTERTHAEVIVSSLSSALYKYSVCVLCIINHVYRTVLWFYLHLRIILALTTGDASWYGNGPVYSTRIRHCYLDTRIFLNTLWCNTDIDNPWLRSAFTRPAH